MYTETTIDFRIQNEVFSFQGKEIVRPGFTKVYPFNAFSSSDQIPDVKQNSSWPILDVGFVSG